MKPKYTSSSFSSFSIKCLSFKKWNWYSQLRPRTWPAKSILNEGSWSHRRACQYFRPVSLTQLRGTCLLLNRLLVVADLWRKVAKILWEVQRAAAWLRSKPLQILSHWRTPVSQETEGRFPCLRQGRLSRRCTSAYSVLLTQSNPIFFKSLHVNEKSWGHQLEVRKLRRCQMQKCKSFCPISKLHNRVQKLLQNLS